VSAVLDLHDFGYDHETLQRRHVKSIEEEEKEKCRRAQKIEKEMMREPSLR
jgi:hypothetical protein